jgi:hypothetical protein
MKASTFAVILALAGTSLAYTLKIDCDKFESCTECLKNSQCSCFTSRNGQVCSNTKMKEPWMHVRWSGDSTFEKLLDNFRYKKVCDDDIRLLKSRLFKNVSFLERKEFTDNAIHLFLTKKSEIFNNESLMHLFRQRSNCQLNCLSLFI